MNLHQILKTVPPEWRSIASHYVRTFQDAGVPAEKIDQLIQWGCSYQGSSEEPDLLAAFRQQTSRMGLSDDMASIAADRGLEAREQINSGKWQPEPQQPDDRDQLLADIRAYRQQWPDDKDMERVELEQLEAKFSGKPAASVQPSPTFDGDLRLKEIRQLCRDDPDAFARNPGLEREQTSLIEAQLASQRTAPHGAVDEPRAAPAQQTGAE